MFVLQTARLMLRWFEERDAEFICALLNDPAWIANIGSRGVRTIDDARNWIAEKLVSSYWQKGHGLWAIERRDDHALVGMCGLLERDSLTDIDVGYALAPQFRGNGYAREAASACVEYARDVLGKDRVLAILSPTNHASIRVLESIGMKPEGVRVLPGEVRETAVFGWGTRRTLDARAELDALIRRFFSAFGNRHAPAPVAAVPSTFLPEAVVSIVKPTAPRGVEVIGMREFIVPRAKLLLEGGLLDFEEEEISHRMDVVGKLAHRASRYRKSGKLHGAFFEGGGEKHFQLVDTARGWKIAALAWEDSANSGQVLNRA